MVRRVMDDMARAPELSQARGCHLLAPAPMTQVNSGAIKPHNEQRPLPEAWPVVRNCYRRQRLSSNALAITLTELSAMAAPAITGLR